MAKLQIAPLPGVVLLVGFSLSYFLLVGKAKPKPLPPEPVTPPVVQVLNAEPADLTLTVSTQGTVRHAAKSTSSARSAAWWSGRGRALCRRWLLRRRHRTGEGGRRRLPFCPGARRGAGGRCRPACGPGERPRAKQAAREWRDLGNAEANELFLRKPQLAGAEAGLRAAEADLGEARLNLSRTSISVALQRPYQRKMVDVGQYITPGTPVARVYDTDVVEVRLPLTDRQVALLDLPLNYQDHSTSGPGAPVTLRARFADREWEWQGRIVRTDASIDVDSRVVYAVAEVEQPFQRDPRQRPAAPVHRPVRGWRKSGP